MSKASGSTKPPQFNRNQFGFAIGGPVYFLNFGEGVPAVYDGHDRTFFFYALQGDKQTTGMLTGGTIRIPTPAGFAALATDTSPAYRAGTICCESGRRLGRNPRSCKVFMPRILHFAICRI